MKQHIVPTSPKSEFRTNGQGHTVFAAIIAAVVFGTLSGAFGFFIAENMLANLSDTESRDRVFFSASRREQSIITQSPEVLDQVASVYSSEPALDQPNAWVGNAVILTADGWFVMPTSVFPSGAERQTAVVLLPSGETEPITQTVDDVFTGMTFFYAAAENLAVVRFPESKQVTVGQTVSVIAKQIGEPVVYERLVAGTQEGERVHMISQRDPLPTLDLGTDTHGMSSPAFYNGGNLAGIVVENGQLIPSQWIEGVLDNVIRAQQATRTALQVASVNVQMLTLDERRAQQLPEHGILVTQGDGTLKAGDVVQVINNVRVNEQTDLKDIVQSHPVGTTLYVTVLRDGNDLAIELVL